MEIVLAAQGLQFGPDTLKHKSLGGSETAALRMVKEMKNLDHLVTIFCNLPPEGEADHVPSGHICEDKVRWVNFEQFQPFIQNTDVDLLIVSRNPDLFQIPHQAKKAVLWCHDLATYKEFLPRLMQHAWNFDEVWTVSEFHRQQIHKITGLPLKSIRATRNGIVEFGVPIKKIKKEKSLLYAARPERGLEMLVRPGGIMSKLPDFELSVCMYANYPEHMMDYYRQIWAWADELPNVKLLGPKTQLELRELMSETWLYAYPTSFEEVSCIIARECIEQQLPVFTTKVGALPETLGNCGYYMEGVPGDETFIDDYVEGVKHLQACPDLMKGLRKFCSKRKDLYWGPVAKDWIKWGSKIERSDYSMVRSMIEDSDIIPARAYLDSLPESKMNKGLLRLKAQLQNLYPFLTGRESYAGYYARVYTECEDLKNDGKGARPNPVSESNIRYTQRFKTIAEHVSNLPEGSKIVDYGCAEGVIILNLAALFPRHQFVGIDFVKSNVELCQLFAKQLKLHNVHFFEGTTDDWPAGDDYDGALCTEVLEHVEKPWEVMSVIESHVKKGGLCVVTTPQGPWESAGLYDKKQWPWRNHIWHVNKEMVRDMFRGKPKTAMASLTDGLALDGRATGHLVIAYEADHGPIHEIDPLKKAQSHKCRQTLAACIIAKDCEDTVIKCLNSIHREAQIIQVALAKSEDNTGQYIRDWGKNHPWVDLRIIGVPPVEVNKFGFDDARNESIKDIEADWILWIDTDEYLSGTILPYLKNNCFDAYALHQHHFTCDPRGAPTQLDKPARLFRNNGKFTFFGKVHEHAELGFNGGPGFVMMMPHTDIGHTGYVNESVRRQRFNRNFPLLEWDTKVYPDRKLGKFLWLRDMIHRIRLLHERGGVEEARRLAEDAIVFYKKNNEVFESVGNNNALAFFSEAMSYLGKGMAVEVSIKLDDKTAAYTGVFENAKEAFELGEKAIGEEFKKRNSGYWQ